MRPQRRQPTVPGILQARTLEWVAVSFSNAGYISVLLQMVKQMLGFYHRTIWSQEGKHTDPNRVEAQAPPLEAHKWMEYRQAPPSVGGDGTPQPHSKHGFKQQLE